MEITNHVQTPSISTFDAILKFGQNIRERISGIAKAIFLAIDSFFKNCMLQISSLFGKVAMLRLFF